MALHSIEQAWTNQSSHYGFRVTRTMDYVVESVMTTCGDENTAYGFDTDVNPYMVGISLLREVLSPLAVYKVNSFWFLYSPHVGNGMYQRYVPHILIISDAHLLGCNSTDFFNFFFVS